MNYFRTFAERFPLNEENFLPGQSFEVEHYVYAVVSGNGQSNENILRNDILDEIIQLNNDVLNTLNVSSSDGQSLLFYRALCLKIDLACFENQHIAMLRNRIELENIGNLIRYQRDFLFDV